MKNKLIALCLCACLAMGLTGCGGETVEDTTSSSEIASLVDNGNLSEDSAVIAVGKTTVPYREFKAYYYFMKNRYEDVMGESVWDYSGEGEGKTIGQEAMEDVVRLIIQVKVICKAAAVQEVTLAADEKEEADHNARNCCAEIPDEVQQENGLSIPLLTQIFEENRLAEKMYNVVTGQADIQIPAEDCRAAKVQLICLKASEEDREAVREKAQQLRQQIADADESFYTFAKANDQGGEIECLIGRLDERKSLADAVLGLKRYEMSPVVEESDGFYIAYVTQVPGKALNKEYKNQMIQKRQTEAFQNAYKEWSGKYGVKVSKSLLDEGED